MESTHGAIASPDRRVTLPADFRNEAGRIQNIFEAPCSGVAILDCAPNSWRASHWHKDDWHVLYVLHGRVKYYERALDEKRVPTPNWYEEGEAFLTPCGVEHALYFPYHTVLLSVSKMNRTHESHESDVVRTEFRKQIVDAEKAARFHR